MIIILIFPIIVISIKFNLELAKIFHFKGELMNLRRNLKTVVVSLLAIVTLSACGTGPSSEPPAQPKSVQVRNNYQSEQLNLNVKSAIAIDSKTGQLLYGKNINQVLPIASMTKLVTTYLTLQAIKEQKLSWDTEVKPTKQIVKVANNKQFSNVPLKMGHSYTIRQLYQATLIESANGAAMLLAQAVSGSQVAFVRQMRQQLKKWGINDAQIYTVCGLPNKSVGTDAYPGADKDAENEMSAKDMAIVGQHLLTDFPEIIETTRIAHLNFTDQGSQTLMTNFNWMLKGLSQYQQDLKVDGLKTGTTDAAGACFIGTAKDSDARLITVVMGARHANSLDPARFEQTGRLLRYVYRNYQPIVFNQNEVIMGTSKINVHNGANKQVDIGMKQRRVIWGPKNGQKLTVNLTKDTIEAPVTQNQTVGSYSFKSGSTKLISIQEPDGIKLPAKALQSTKQVNFLLRFWHRLFGG